MQRKAINLYGSCFLYLVLLLRTHGLKILTNKRITKSKRNPTIPLLFTSEKDCKTRRQPPTMMDISQIAKSVWPKFLVLAIFLLCAWNATKVPFFMAFDADGDTPYEKGGLEGSINLSNWIHVSHVQLEYPFPLLLRCAPNVAHTACS
jgi:hypothetical protein